MIIKLIKKFKNRQAIHELQKKIKGWEDYQSHCMSEATLAEIQGHRSKAAYLRHNAEGSQEFIDEYNRQLNELL